MKKKPAVRRARWLAACLATIGLLAGIYTLALAATPERPAPAAAGPAAPVNPLVEAVPQAWGNPEPAKRPQAAAKPKEPASTAVVPLPPPTDLARMPVGRVQVGSGRVDPNRALRYRAVYVVRAQTAGIVEYLYDATNLTRMGQPLVRLYDLSILSDLHIGESIMARFATGPFVIAPRQSGLPPVPPANFPQPTVLQRLLGIRSAPRPTLAPQQPAQAPAPAQAGTSRRSGLAPRAGLEPAPAAPEPAQAAPSTKTIKQPTVANITRTTADITAARARISELNGVLAKIEADTDGVESDLAEARADEASRKRLYDQGVLARNVYEAAQKKTRDLENELASLRGKRDDTSAARETALQRLSHLQDQLDQQVANRRDEAAELPTIGERQPLPAQTPRQAPVARRSTLSSRRATLQPEGFPEPTQPRRPELRQLPRVQSRRSSSRLVGVSEIPAIPGAVTRLATPRWTDQAAPGDGLVTRQLVPPGAQVQPGQPLLEVVNREFARVYSDVAMKNVGQFHRGAPVTITFDGYPGVLLEGWVNDVQSRPDGLARVEMVVVARDGYYPEDTYASLEWLALAAPLATDDAAEAVAPATAETEVGAAGPTNVYAMLPVVPPSVGPAQDKVKEVREGEFVGLIRMAEMGPGSAASHSNPQNAARLAKLRQWRDSFTAGMQTGIFGSLVLTYPKDNEVGRAVERMASARVSHVPNRCARTMREALGWGLGDAAMWLHRLPERGYMPRKDGLARPGDILVWPFTYGPRRTQHIGIAVNQAGRLMCLSNLGGTLGTAELLGGYVAFYKPEPKPTVKPQAAPQQAKSSATR